jgi:acyl transferase domain-containing protein/acyl carrier protein
MENTSYRAIAVVGVGAVLPDAPNVTTFWENIKSGRYSVTEVDPKRWDPALYFNEDHAAPDKTYSKIGGWVREFTWEPIKWHLPVPPKVVDAMDGAQRWAIACTREALEDYGYPKRPLDADRTAVILGNAMAGEKHYMTALRIYSPEYERDLAQVESFAALPEELRNEITRKLRERIAKDFPTVTEDSMPGELSNCIAGRIANLFNFHGPNYVCDAACASAMAAMSSAIEGLVQKDFDTVITGGIDRNMGASTFVKFCKIGALSATGTRPYAEGADGFVMGEGAALFLMKRLADAERDGDKIYAVVRGIGGSSDGKGKGITAPNPVGQKFAIERAWQNAGLSPATATYIEGHGTSTRVGDQVEVQSMAEVLSTYHLPPHTVALGSVKSNFGHLKGAAGAAGLLKATLALHNKVLPPSLHCDHPSPEIDFAHSPLYVNTELKPWTVPAEVPRRAGLSAFGFGGTNFHAVLEEYIPHRLNGNGNGKRSVVVTETATKGIEATVTAKEVFSAPRPSAGTSAAPSATYKAPLRGALMIGAATEAELIERLRVIEKDAKAGSAPTPTAPSEADLRAPERLAIDYANAAELAIKAAGALKALAANQPAIWKALRAQGIFRGHGPAPRVAFLYPGQGSQYVNMLKPLCAKEPIVAETFAEADRVMTPILGKPLSEFIFVDHTDNDAVAKAEEDLRQTAITQPAVLASDLALTRLLAAYGVEPDFTMGHSLGEYGALVVAGGLPFADALEAVSARGREMTRFSPEDKGLMAAVFAPLEEVERILKTVEGYVVIANVNSEHQSVVGGASKPVQQAMELFQKAGYEVSPLSVSHAFHTSIVASASEPLRRVLERLHVQAPRLPIVANTNGKFYPTGADVVPKMLDILAQQVAAPVQFVTGLRTLYEAGARVFVEVGPKKALSGFAEDVLGPKGDIVSLFTNHPKVGDVPSFNQALCCLYAAGLGRGVREKKEATSIPPYTDNADIATKSFVPTPVSPTSSNGNHYVELGKMFADVLERGWQITHGNQRIEKQEPVTITGAALGLPGTEHIFDDGNVARLLRGDQFINSIPTRFRDAMLGKHITRLVKSENGNGNFETITDVADVIKLAGRGGEFDLENEFGVSADRRAALDRVTQLAIAVGLDALRDAGIPLVLHYKTTSKGTKLPDRWTLPEALRDDTGVIFASAFPGYDAYADEMSRYYADHERREQLGLLQTLRAQVTNNNGSAALAQELDRRIKQQQAAIEKEPYVFDRRFLFRVLSMGHSQFAEFIGARGPNTAVNAACASTTQAVALAEDWIRAGRCKRVVVVAADDITSDHLIEWMGAGFLASGAAATDEVVEDAAVPFDKRRHGMIIGMGAAGLVVESAEAARERGIQPICEVLSAVTANSAFHGTRLDVQHIGQVMEDLVSKAESRSGIDRREIAPKTVFVSHETYTPARGGSAAAEIHALRKVFGNAADQIVIANTKGFTGHAMGAGVEDVLAVKALESGLVPPVANFKEIDPELGALNLSKGGTYPVEYALRLGAGFGSQISMTLLRWVATKDGARHAPNGLGYAYRIVDSKAWDEWLSRLAGHPNTSLEVVHRTLRVRDEAAAARATEVASATKIAPASVPALKAPLAAVPVASAKPIPIEPKPVVVAKPAPVVVPAANAPIPIPTKKESEIKVAPVAATASEKPVETSPVAKPSSGGDVRERVLALVVEKTGYPQEMLDVDLDLEADLGVDTVKQAELLAAIREIYNIPRDENRKLRDYPTLAHVIRFVYEKRPDLASATGDVARAPSPASAAPVAAVTTAPSAVPSTAQVSADEVKERVLALVVEKTGYPKDMLDLALDLEADLGVDTVKQAEMFAAIREIYSIPRDENRKLRDYPTLAHVIRFVFEKRPDLAAPAAASEPRADQLKQEPTPAKEEQPALIKKEETKAASPAPVMGNSEAVKERVLELVVEKTGYPKDMLDLDLDLEADLGVDTVKQAEMFVAIREIYNIPRDENRKLRDYPTLGHVIRFVFENRPDLAGATQNAAPAPAAAKVEEPVVEATVSEPPTPVAAAPTSNADEVRERVLALVVEKTEYPKDMLDLDLDLEADLGVDTVKQAEMFAAIREIYSIPRDENRKLRDYPTIGHVIRFVLENRPNLLGAPPPQKSAAEVNAPVAGEDARSSTPRIEEPAAATSTQVAATASTASAAVADSIKERVLDIVAEKTGYPKDMLDVELDLEADLGIDTVKQAEMFAAIRASYNIPRDENLKLREFPTLAHVIKFAQDRSGLLTAQKTEEPAKKPAVSAASVAPSRPEKKAPRPPAPSLEAANTVPRRVPLPVLRPALNLCKPSGATLDRGDRVIIAADKSGVAEAATQLLQEKGVEALRIETATDAESLNNLLKKWTAAGPIHGVYWLPALDYEGNINEMNLSTWHEAIRVRVQSLYTTMRALYEHIAKPGTFFVSATRLGGQHGYDEAGAFAPLGGAVAGFTKAYKRERSEATVKAIDFEFDRKAAEIAELLVNETLRDPGAVEIGYKDGLRWTVGLQEQPAADGQRGLTLDESTVFVITGAAGSIVSAITADLAAASDGTFYLLDLAPEPDPNDPDLKRFITDKDGLKRELFARIQARGERATPALVEKELATLERLQAAQSAIDAVKAAGGTAHYFSVNLTDAEAVTEIISQVRERSGKVDVLLHAAGLERSRFLGEKDQREFDLVFDVKSDGFFNLLRAIGDMPLKATVGFSSVAGRFGNAGQTDYSSANDLLCKITSSFRTTRPDTRGIVIDWSAWGGIGMASRGSIPKMMEMAGIEMIPAEAGVPVIRRELTAGGTRGEIVIAKKIGVLLKEWDETGGLDVSAAEVNSPKAVAARGPMTGKIAGTGVFEPLRIETTLDPKTQPFLYDHQIDNIPVLPGVMGIEAFAEAALTLLPGWYVEAIDEVNYMAPFKFYRNEPRTVFVEAVVHPVDGELVADCKLIGRRTLPNQTEPQVTTHFSARVRLTKEPKKALTVAKLGSPVGNVISSKEIYPLYFHGPAYQVVEKAWWDGNRIVGLFSNKIPGNHHPSELLTSVAPRLIELCFQTSGVWEMGIEGRMGLPLGIDRVEIFGATENVEDRLYAVVTPNAAKGNFDADIVDAKGNCYLRLTGYRTVAVPNAVDTERVKALQAAMLLEPVAA